jgi:hypothetical protein
MIYGDECNFLHSVISFLFGPNILLQTLFSNALSLCNFLNTRDKVSHPYKTRGKIMVLYILSFTFQTAGGKTKHSESNGRKHSPDLICS